MQADLDGVYAAAVKFRDTDQPPVGRILQAQLFQSGAAYPDTQSEQRTALSVEANTVLVKSAKIAAAGVEHGNLSFQSFLFIIREQGGIVNVCASEYGEGGRPGMLTVFP